MRKFDLQKILREELQELSAYTPSAGDFEVRLDANEAPDLLSDGLKQRLAAVAAQTCLRKYPDAGQVALRESIAAHHGVNANQIIAGVGSDELITLLLTAATRLKSRAPLPTVLTTTPSFVMYRLSARARGQRVIEVPLLKDWDIDEVALLRAIEMAEPNVIFIASPNNPTGTMASKGRLKTLIEAAPNSLVVVDEAYIDYADRNQMGLLNDYENVAILRTLSKVGFASLRVGWLIANSQLVAELDKVRLPYNLPTLSQELATTVFREFSEDLRKQCDFVREERTRVALELQKLPGVTPVPSQANFLWLELESSASELFNRLRERGVLLRCFQGRGGRLDRCLRVTIGNRKENDRFLETFQESL